MNINSNSSNSSFSIELYLVETNKDTKALKKITGKKLADTLAQVTNDKALTNIAIRKGDIFVMSKENILSDKKFILIEDNKEIDLTGRVREANEQDFADIQTFANQYFAKMNEDKGEEKNIKKSVFKRNWQPEGEGDKRAAAKNTVAKRAIEQANEQFGKEISKELKEKENKSNQETGKKIRRFYEGLKQKNEEYINKEKESNRIN